MVAIIFVGGPLQFVDTWVAFNREHMPLKPKRYASDIIKKPFVWFGQHYGRVPLKWWLYQPYAVWFKSLI